MRTHAFISAAAIAGVAAQTQDIVYPSPAHTTAVVEDAAATSGKSFDHILAVLANTERMDVPRFRNEFLQLVGVEVEKHLAEQTHEFKRPNATAVEFP